MNVLKRGLDAKTPILPGEDDAAFRTRLEAWRAGSPPRSPEEEALLEEAVRLSWQLDRAIAAHTAHEAERLRLATDAETRQRAEAEAAAEAAEVGSRLLDGPPAPQFKIDKIAKRLARMYASPFWSQYTPLVDINRLRGKRLVMPMHPDDPGHPQRLLRCLESSAAGCRWLLDRCSELRAALDSDSGWRPEERLRAVRLLGKEPVDAIDDPAVQSIYLCCLVLDSHSAQVFNDQRVELTNREFEAFLALLKAQRVADRVPTSREGARQRLWALVDGVLARLEARAAGLAERAERAAAVGRLPFDGSAQGERLRRLQLRIHHSFLRTVDQLMELRRLPTAHVPGPARNGAASQGGVTSCEKLRNEPNADPRPAPPAPHVGQAFQPDGMPGNQARSPDPREPGSQVGKPDRRACTTPAAGPEPARDVATTSAAIEPCEKLRNEPNADRVRWPTDLPGADPGRI